MQVFHFFCPWLAFDSLIKYEFSFQMVASFAFVMCFVDLRLFYVPLFDRFLKYIIDYSSNRPIVVLLH